MNRKAEVALSVACGVACAACMLVYTGQVRDQANQARNDALARYGGEQLEVCVASQDIAAGDVIRSSNVVTRQWLVDLLPEEAIESYDGIAGQRIASPVVAGEVLSQRHFEADALEIDVPSELEAVSIEVQQSQAIGGALKAGIGVDVYATGSTETSCIVRGAYVVSVGNSGSTSTWVTLAVRPELVEQLIASTQTSTLYLALPSQADSAERDFATSSPEVDSALDAKAGEKKSTDLREGGEAHG